jgi:dienelactone hydrolase
MKWKVIVILIGVVVNAVLTGCTSTAVFTSLDINNSGKQQTLKGKLTKPDGDGPFPAVVLLHGCSGVQDHHYRWAGKLKRWGFVSLIVDSFGPRGKSNICASGGHTIMPYRRAKDAHGAKLYLESLPFIDPNRIAVMGWSHGAMSALEAVEINEPSSSSFQVCVAFYPFCKQLFMVNSPLLVLIGEKDDWTPANLCKYYIKPKENWPEIVLKVYPDAYHSFDETHKIGFYLGHVTGHNQLAAEDSYKMVKAFLEKYLVD